jgi:hypothetical protein
MKTEYSLSPGAGDACNDVPGIEVAPPVAQLALKLLIEFGLK